jgi:hypothetical protein
MPRTILFFEKYTNGIKTADWSVLMKHESTKIPLVIFMHIPKTGGITLRNILDQQYRSEHILRLPQKNKLVNLQKKGANIKELQCVYGHHRFGVHEYFQQPFTYITMLRHPVERIISTYYFILQNERNRMHQKVKPLTFEQFVRSTDPDLQVPLTNHQTRYLSGERKPNLNKALQHMDAHFSVVGITELYNESLFIMKKKLGWDHISYQKKNVTKKRKRQTDIGLDTIEIIKRKNPLDLHLYETAKEKLQEHIKRLDSGARKELQQFLQDQNGFGPHG